MRKNLSIVLLFLVIFSGVKMHAQKITVRAYLDSTVLKIGDQAHLSFEISQQPSQKVSCPQFSDSIVGGLDLVERTKSDTVKSNDGQLLVTQRYVVTAFEDSLLYIPPFPFITNGDTVWSKSLSLKVVQPFKIDTAANTITDIKSVMDPKFDWTAFVRNLLLGLFAVGLLIVLVIFIRKFWQKKPIFEAAPAPVLPPHVIAMSLLDKIKQEKPWQHGRSKQYHTELTDVIREYLEHVFGIKSMEMTSDEILDQLRMLRIEQKSTFLLLKQILQLADLVKFAKFNPAPTEHELSLTNAYLFISQTTVEEQKPSTETKTEEQKAN